MDLEWFKPVTCFPFQLKTCQLAISSYLLILMGTGLAFQARREILFLFCLDTSAIIDGANRFSHSKGSWCLYQITLMSPYVKCQDAQPSTLEISTIKHS